MNDKPVPRSYDRADAFTLVELLVVIGIIALLIGILLPTLTRARQAAQRAVCAAKLQQIMVAANVHATDHAGYYPLAGILTGGQPQELDDPDTRKYDYRNTDASQFTYYNTASIPWVTRALAPITVALGSEMGFKQNLNYNWIKTQTVSTDTAGLYRCFFCPSQCDSEKEFWIQQPTKPAGWIINWTGTQSDPAYGYISSVPSSYIFNEYVLGFNDGYGRLRGHASLVRHPSQTVFAFEGLGSTNLNDRSGELPQNFVSESGVNPSALGTITVYNNFPNPLQGDLPDSPVISLGDILNSRTSLGMFVAGNLGSFDAKRHQGKVNIAFCDGHVETRSVTVSDLQNVFLVPP